MSKYIKVSDIKNLFETIKNDLEEEYGDYYWGVGDGVRLMETKLLIKDDLHTDDPAKVYYLYAERHPDYGRTEYGYYSSYEKAVKVKAAEFEKAKKSTANSEGYKIDGYYEDDWHIEEIEID